jgi:uncharacterized membrane protein
MKTVSNKKETALDKFTHAIAWFIGSWAGVVVHTVWFIAWLALGWNINLLTLILSMEAIYLCIFLLMAANEAEQTRDHRDRFTRKRTMKIMSQDLVLDERAERRQKEIVRMIRGLEKEVQAIKKNQH